MKVWVFFYGSYMNFDVLREVDYVPEESFVARLSGHDIVIRPRANLIRSTEHVIYGVVATATHDQLDRLYTEHALGKLGERYRPQAVLVETLVGQFVPVLTYICSEMVPRPADPEYVERIARPARQRHFPDWYVRRIESFAAP